MKGKIFFNYALIFISVLLLAACSSQPTRSIRVEDRSTDQAKQSGNTKEPLVQADEKYARGDYATAAKLYHDLANGDPFLRIKAADAYARAGNNKLAREELKRVEVDRLRNEERLLYKIVRAQLAINKGRAREAFGLLPREAPNTSLDTQIRLGMARADAWLALGRNADAVMERIDIDSFIIIPEERTLNHQWIWNQLQNMPREDIFSPPPGMSQDDAGWWALAAIVKRGSYRKPVGGKSELEVWKETYPGHPATEDILFFIESDPATGPATLEYSGTVLENMPHNVALLLPLSGHYAQAGQRVLSGFRERAQNASFSTINYKVYDSADLNYSLGDIANYAVSDGAEMLIGPLQKTAVANLLSYGDPGVPVLALNTLPPGSVASEGLFQFGLSPENEAVEVARRALADGHYRTVVLASEDKMGERIVNAFMAAFEEGGGRIVAYDTFTPKSNTISDVVKQLLRAGTSDPLWEDVRKGTNRKSNDEQHIDMIFFTASPRDSRVIRPIIQLHRAFDLPVYSSARVNTQPDPVMDKDLEGLIFCDMPAVLSGGSGLSRLEALGADAYLLANQLHNLSQSPGMEIPGETGRLSITSTGEVWRHLDCAVFKSGEPKLLP